jgi:hypothetical protein
MKYVLLLTLALLIAGCQFEPRALVTPTRVPVTATVVAATADIAVQPTDDVSLPMGYRKLGDPIEDASWDARKPGVRLGAGTVYKILDERFQLLCRIVLLDGAKPWVPCESIGISIPATPTLVPTLVPPTAVPEVCFTVQMPTGAYTGCGSTEEAAKAKALAQVPQIRK